MIAYLLFWMAEPEAGALLGKAMEARRAQSERGAKFTYQETVERKQLDKNGRVTGRVVDTYDVIMLEGENYQKLVLRDGKALPEKVQKQVDQEMEAAREQRRKRRLLSVTKTVNFGGLEQVQKLFDLRVAGREQVGGRWCWKVEATPKAGYRAANKDDEYALKMKRTIWFDEEVGIDVKRVDDFLEEANGFQPGSQLLTEFMPLGEDWVISRLELRYDVKARVFLRGRGETVHRMSGHKKFQAESNLVP